MSRYNKAAPFNLEAIKALISAGYSFIQLRVHLKCNNGRLRSFMLENGLAISEETNRISNLNRQIAAQRARSSIEPGRGGDEAFAKLIGPNLFGQPNPAAQKRKHQPTHYPHRTPGDDFSSCGSSMRHSEGGKW